MKISTILLGLTLAFGAPFGFRHGIAARWRGLLGELCHIVERLLIQAYTGAAVECRLGSFVQTQ